MMCPRVSSLCLAPCSPCECLLATERVWPVLTPSSRPHDRTPHQPTMRWVGGDPGTERAQSRALTGLRAPSPVRRALSPGVTISAHSLLRDVRMRITLCRVMISCSAGPGRAGRRTFKHEIRRTNDGFSLPYKGVELPGGWDKFQLIFRV